MTDYFMYVDESGDSGFPPIKGKSLPTVHYILTGFILPFIPTINKIQKEFRQEVFSILLKRYPNFPLSAELRGANIMNVRSNNDFKKFKVTLNDRIDFYFHVIQCILKHFSDGKISSILIDKSIKQEYFLKYPNDIKYIPWNYLPQRFNTFLYYKKALGKIYSDRTYDNYVINIFNNKFKSSQILIGGSTVVDIPWTNIESIPYFLNSKSNTLIQIADLIAYALYLQDFPTKNAMKYNLDRLYKYLSPLYNLKTGRDGVYRV